MVIEPVRTRRETLRVTPSADPRVRTCQNVLDDLLQCLSDHLLDQHGQVFHAWCSLLRTGAPHDACVERPSTAQRVGCLGSTDPPARCTCSITTVNLFLKRVHRTHERHGVSVLLAREPEHAVWAQSPKISVLASRSASSSSVAMDCVRSMATSVPSLASWSPAPASGSSLSTCTPPAVSGV